MLVFVSITTIQQQVYPSKDDDDINNYKKEKRDTEKKLANIMDLIDQFNTSELVEMCQYMQDSGYYK